jgi:hypothetical protein
MLTLSKLNCTRVLSGALLAAPLFAWADAMDSSSMSMHGVLGGYSMARESSGTSWQPDSSPMDMHEFEARSWTLMPMASVNAVYSDSKAHARGDSDTFVQSMAMLMAHRPLGQGTLGVRTMLSLDPAFMGKKGYPLLFQTGETADGKTPLIDRQHPHDLFMELAASYAMNLNEHASAFLYAGLPGEPALGPSTYMHRLSGMDNPEAPITHHWFDATHITFGVATVGLVLENVKLETSAFNGHEPDPFRYNIEIRALDSWSARATYNPALNWSAQVSYGHIKSPEQLEPGIDVDRTTASVTYNRPLTQGGWQSTLAIARNDQHPGGHTDAYLLESSLPFPNRFTVFARAERVGKNELFEEGEPLAGRTFTVGKLALGAVHDVTDTPVGTFSVGATFDLYSVPNELQSVYGRSPTSWLVFLRWKWP